MFSVKKLHFHWVAQIGILLSGYFYGPEASAIVRPRLNFSSPPSSASERFKAIILKRLSKPTTFVSLSNYCNESSGEKKPCVLLINFMASDCPACIQEIPEFLKVIKSYKDTAIVPLMVSTDGYSNQLQAGEYLNNLSSKIPVLLDPSGVASDFFEVVAIPRIFAITPDGFILGSIEGAGANFNSQLNSLIKKAISINSI